MFFPLRSGEFTIGWVGGIVGVTLFSLRGLLDRGICPNENVIVNGSRSNGGTVVTCFVVNEDRGDHGHVFRHFSNNVHAGTFSRSGLSSPRLVVCGPCLSTGSNGVSVVAGNSRAGAVFSFVGRNGAFRSSLHAHRCRSSVPGFAPHVSNVLCCSSALACGLSVLGDSGNEPVYGHCFCSCATRGNVNRFVRACGYSNGPVPSFCNRPRRISVPGATRRLTSLI